MKCKLIWFFIIVLVVTASSLNANLSNKAKFLSVENISDKCLTKSLFNVNSNSYKHKFNIEISSGIFINRKYNDNEVLPKTQRIKNNVFSTTNISCFAVFKQLSLGIGGKYLFDTKIINDENAVVYFKSFYSVFLSTEYNLIKKNLLCI